MMGIPMFMYEAIKAFPPTDEHKEAALAAAIAAGECFIVETTGQAADGEVSEKLRDAASEVWEQYQRVCSSRLLTKELRDQLPPLYSYEDGRDPMVWCKFFTPDAGWTWYAIKFDGLDVFYGWVVGSEEEYGYFTLTELEEVRGPLGLSIERDLHFTPMKLSEVRALHPLQAPLPVPSSPALGIYVVVSQEEWEQQAWDKGFAVVCLYRDDLLEGLGATPEQLARLTDEDMGAIARAVEEAYVHFGSFFEDVRQAVNRVLKEKGGKEIPARQDAAYPVASVCRDDLKEVDVSDEHIALLTGEDMAAIASIMEDLYCDHDYWDDLAHAVGVVLKEKGVESDLSDAVPIIVPLVPSDEAEGGY